MPRTSKTQPEDCDLDGSTVPQKSSSLRKGGFVLLQGKPCKIVEMNTSSPGKHGHAKIHFVGLDIFSEKKVEDICVSTHKTLVPIVKRQEYEMLSINPDGFFTLMDAKGILRSDLQMTPACNIKEQDDIEAMVRKAEETDMALIATVWSALDNEEVKDIRIGKHI